MSLKSLSNLAIAHVQYGMTTDNYAALWDKVRLGAINGLYRGEAAGERLENTQEIEMLLGALTVVDD